MRWLLLVAGLLACHPAAAYLPPGPGLPTASNEEFVGPFANWINVRTGKRADGTGSVVCTAALADGSNDAPRIQSCIDLLGATYPRLWFPAGTYTINSCLHLGKPSCVSGVQAGLSSVGIIGADPATTTILWGGSCSGAMIGIFGVNYSEFSRMTVDANNCAAIAVDQDYATGFPNFDTGNQYADITFKNATSVGFRCGLTAGCAETTILRDQFINNFVGVFVFNQNALDLWIWYSLFQDNTYGVSNQHPTATPSSSFHVFNSVFLNTLKTDISYGSITTGTFRNNYSIGAGAGGGVANADGHFIWAGGSNGVNPIIVQGNTILDWTPGSGSFPQAVFQQDSGPIVLIDNVFRNSVANSAAPVVSNGNSIASLFSMGNTFTVGTISATCVGSSPVTILATGLCHSINDQAVSRSTVNPPQPTLPGTPPNNNRTILEVPSASSVATIQAAVNSAVAAGSKSVVHLQSGAGGATLNTTLTTPANSDIQIIGDGRNSFYGWNGASGTPLLKVNGPSQVTLRDFRFISGAEIEVNTVDQVGSRVFMQGVLTGGPTSGAAIFVDALDNTLVEMYDTQVVSNSTAATTGLKVTGGASAAAGTWLGGATNWFTGLTAGNTLSAAQSDGSHLYVGAVWYDAQADPSTRKFLTGTGNAAGAVSLIGTPMHLATNPAILFSSFLGKDSLVGIPMGVASVSTVNITGAAAGSENLGLGLAAINPPYYIDTATGAHTTEFLNSINNTTPASPSTLTETSITTPFLTSVLQQMRTTQPSFPIATPAGVTGVQMYRVTVETGVNNIHIRN